MKMKKEYIILVIVIIALSVYLVMRRDDRTLYELPEIPAVAQKDINRIQITKGKSVVDLTKKDDNWYIAPQEYPADNNKVRSMLDNLEKLTLTALVSESKNYNLYDLSGENGINIKAWHGDSLKRDIDVGKTASSYRHTFVKPAGDDRVFHARGNFRNTFDSNVDDLRDKAVLAFNEADIQQIQITDEKQSIVLKKTMPPDKEEAASDDKEENAPAPPQKSVWQAPDGQIVDEAAVNNLLNRLSNLRCDKFIDDRKKDDFTSPQLTIQFKGPQEYSLDIFALADEKDTEHPATSSGSNYAFLLSKSTAEAIMENSSKILKNPEAEKANPENLQQNDKQPKG